MQRLRRVLRGNLGKVFFSMMFFIVLTIPVSFAATTGAGLGPQVGWQTYNPSNYQWDILQPSGFSLNPLNGSIPQGINAIANVGFDGLVQSFYYMLSFLKFAIDPKELINPIANELGTILHGAYQTVYMRMLPAVLAIGGIFILYRFARAHHASVAQIVGMMVLVMGFAVFFYNSFDKVVIDLSSTDSTLASLSMDLTAGAGQAVLNRPGDSTNSIDPSLSTIWDTFILGEWETGEFGSFNANTAVYQVSPGEVAAFNLSGAVSQAFGGSSTQQSFTMKPTDNWIPLMLSRGASSDERYSLAKVLYSPDVPHGDAVKIASSVAPTDRLIWDLVIVLPTLIPIVFLGIMAVLLLLYSLGFLAFAIGSICIIPLGIIPDYGWNVFFRTIGKMLGMLISKIINSLYLGIALLVMDLVATAGSFGSSVGLVIALYVNSAICIAAIIYRSWFVRAISSRLPERYNLRFRELRDRARIEGQRGARPWRKMHQRLTGAGARGKFGVGGRSSKEDDDSRKHSGMSSRMRNRSSSPGDSRNNGLKSDSAATKRKVGMGNRGLGVGSTRRSTQKTGKENKSPKSGRAAMPSRDKRRVVKRPINGPGAAGKTSYKIKNGNGSLRQAVSGFGRANQSGSNSTERKFGQRSTTTANSAPAPSHSNPTSSRTQQQEANRERPRQSVGKNASKGAHPRRVGQSAPRHDIRRRATTMSNLNAGNHSNQGDSVRSSDLRRRTTSHPPNFTN